MEASCSRYIAKSIFLKQISRGERDTGFRNMVDPSMTYVMSWFFSPEDVKPGDMDRVHIFPFEIDEEQGEEGKRMKWPHCQRFDRQRT